MLVWMVLFAPEPKGLSLEEIEVVFHGPLIVTKLDYNEYIQSHRAEIEKIRNEVDFAAGQSSDTDIEKSTEKKVEDTDSFNSRRAEE